MFENIDEKQNVKTVKVTLPHEDVEKARNNAYADISKNIKVKGFRTGMVPRKLLDAIIGMEKINGMVKEILADWAMDKLYADEKFQELNLMLPPALTSIDMGKSADVIFELHSYPNVTVDSEAIGEIEIPPLSDEDIEENVNRQLQNMREENAILEPKGEEETIEIGDQVEAEYHVLGTDKKPKEVEIVVKDPKEGKIFRDLIGKKAGDTIEFEEGTGEDKTKYSMIVKRVYKRKLANLDDDFAKMVDNEVQTLADLKIKLRKEIRESLDKIIKEGEINAILKKLTDKTKLDMSEHSLDLFINHVISRQKEKKEYEKSLKDFNGNEEAYRDTLKKEITSYLKLKGAVEKIAKEKGIEVSEDEIFEKAKEYYKSSGMSDERLKVILSKDKDFYNRVKNDLLQHKVAEELLKTAKVVVMDATEEEKKEADEIHEEEEKGDE